MKKVSALFLAMILLALCSTTATATSTFSDEASISQQYKTSVDYAVQTGIISGYADGTFRPKQNLTRGAATKIIASMELGVEKSSALTTDYTPFTDISATNVFAGSIAYCSNQGYINGYSDGTFRAGNPLTAEAFAKMLLCAIKYPSHTGYTGVNWKNIVLQDALTCGVFQGNMGFAASDGVTREQAAYLLYNAAYWKENGTSRPDDPVIYAEEETPIIQQQTTPTVAPTTSTPSKATPSYGTSKNLPASAVPLTVEALQGVWLGGTPIIEGYSCSELCEYNCNRHFLNISGNNFNLDHLWSTPECQDVGTFYVDGPNIIATYRRHFPATGQVGEWKSEIWPVEYIFPDGIRFQYGVAGYKSFWSFFDGASSYGQAVTVDPTTPPSMKPTLPTTPSIPSTPPAQSAIPSAPSAPQTGDIYPNGAPTYTAVTGTPLKNIMTSGKYRCYVYNDTGEYIDYIQHLISIGWHIYANDTVGGSPVCHLTKDSIMISVVYYPLKNEVWILV